MCNYVFKPSDVSIQPLPQFLHGSALYSVLKSQGIQELMEMQACHDRACDCNRRLDLKGNYIGRYPNIIGGAAE